MRLILFAALALAVLLSAVALRAQSSSTAAEQKLPSVGEVAPTFTLPTQDGSPLSLASQRGHWVVLYFYPKDKTPGCTIEAHNFQRDLAEFTKRNAVILGVSLDSAASHQSFCSKESLTFHLLADTEHTVTSLYGSLGSFALIKIANRNTFLIAPDGKIAKIWTGVSVQHHSEEVLAAIDALK